MQPLNNNATSTPQKIHALLSSHASGSLSAEHCATQLTELLISSFFEDRHHITVPMKAVTPTDIPEILGSFVRDHLQKFENAEAATPYIEGVHIVLSQHCLKATTKKAEFSLTWEKTDMTFYDHMAVVFHDDVKVQANEIAERIFAALPDYQQHKQNFVFPRKELSSVLEYWVPLLPAESASLSQLEKSFTQAIDREYSARKETLCDRSHREAFKQFSGETLRQHLGLSEDMQLMLSHYIKSKNPEYEKDLLIMAAKEGVLSVVQYVLHVSPDASKLLASNEVAAASINNEHTAVTEFLCNQPSYQEKRLPLLIYGIEKGKTQAVHAMLRHPFSEEERARALVKMVNYGHMEVAMPLLETEWKNAHHITKLIPAPNDTLCTILGHMVDLNKVDMVKGLMDGYQWNKKNAENLYQNPVVVSAVRAAIKEGKEELITPFVPKTPIKEFACFFTRMIKEGQTPMVQHVLTCWNKCSQEHVDQFYGNVEFCKAITKAARREKTEMVEFFLPTKVNETLTEIFGIMVRRGNMPIVEKLTEKYAWTSSQILGVVKHAKTDAAKAAAEYVLEAQYGKKKREVNAGEPGSFQERTVSSNDISPVL